jgi:hypothetical protein
MRIIFSSLLTMTRDYNEVESSQPFQINGRKRTEAIQENSCGQMVPIGVQQ